jgi:hypothetical protein
VFGIIILHFYDTSIFCYLICGPVVTLCLRLSVNRRALTAHLSESIILRITVLATARTRPLVITIAGAETLVTRRTGATNRANGGLVDRASETASLTHKGSSLDSGDVRGLILVGGV